MSAMSRHVEQMVYDASHGDFMRFKKKEAVEKSTNFVDGMLLPHGKVRQAWDLAVVVVLLYVVLSEPVFLGFNVELTGPVRIIDPLVLSFFALDVIVNFRTAFEDKHSQLVTGWKLVAMHYLKSTECFPCFLPRWLCTWSHRHR